MTIELNHTIVGATDKHASARFLASILGRAVGADDGPFTPVRLDNGVTLDSGPRHSRVMSVLGVAG